LRFRGSNAVARAAQAIRSGDIDRHRRRRGIDDARALRPGQGERAFSRAAQIYDTTIGWRFIKPSDEAAIWRRPMPETGENVAEGIPGQTRRSGRVRLALAQQRAGKAIAGRLLRRGIVSVEIAARSRQEFGDDDEPRAPIPRSGLAKLKTPSPGIPGTVTAGNASGVNDRCSRDDSSPRRLAVKGPRLTPRAKITAWASAGVPPRHHAHRPGAFDPQTDGAARTADRDFDVIAA